MNTTAQPGAGGRRQESRTGSDAARVTVPSQDHAIGRRAVLTLTAAAFAVTLVGSAARADSPDDATVFGPVQQLDDALIAAMKAGDTMSFDQRYRVLEPVIDRVFNLNAVLALSIGLSWASMPSAQKAALAAAFRRYTVSSYVANFNSYNGQSFKVLPITRAVGNGEVVVRTRLVRRNKSPVKLDYVMRSGPDGWRVVDVLTDGSISRVAVQRSDFQQLLEDGGAPALAEGLDRKVAALSGAMEG